MRNRSDFDTQRQFEDYVDYMMGNPADDWENVLVKVYWCSKSDGHWDIEGTCYPHRAGEYVWWPENDLDNIPEGKEEAIHCVECKSPAAVENCPFNDGLHSAHGHLCLGCSAGYE